MNRLQKDGPSFHFHLAYSKPEGLHQIATVGSGVKQTELLYQVGYPLHFAAPRNRLHRLARQQQIIVAANLRWLRWLDVTVKKPPGIELCEEDYRDANVGMNTPEPVVRLQVTLFPLFHTHQRARARR